jgi:uncharacterized PurR-regulated membrane protein YhhQ (DUF165 family)
MKANEPKPQPNFHLRMLVGVLFYPVAFFIMFFIPDFGDKSEEVAISFVIALFSSLSCAILMPVLLHSPRAQKTVAICLLIIPICAGIYAWLDLAHYFLIELKYHHRNWILLKWLKLP